MARADLVAPCGTEAAARRHRRRRETVCVACTLAAAQAKARRGGSGRLLIDPRALRNGVPETPGYTWRARTYPWAQQALAAAEATHGAPDPTCAGCDRPMSQARAALSSLCGGCEYEPAQAVAS